MTKLNNKGSLLAEVVISMVLLGMCLLLLSMMTQNVTANISDVKYSRTLADSIQGVFEDYQLEVTRYRDIAITSTATPGSVEYTYTGLAADTGRYDIVEKVVNSKTIINEVTVKGGVLNNGEKLFLVTVKAYFKNDPKNFVVDTELLSRGVGANATPIS
jgi:hypothetical protein